MNAIEFKNLFASILKSPYFKKSSKALLIFIIAYIVHYFSFGAPQEDFRKHIDTSIKTESCNILFEGTTTAYVVNVIDGDTVDVSFDEKSHCGQERVRLLGVDTPEVVDPRKPVQCFGVEASNFTKSEFSQKGAKVTLEFDSQAGTRDKYQRLLAYVFVKDENFNKRLIENGYAHEYTYQIPYKYQKEFKAAQKIAKSQKVGLWAPGVCNVK